MEIRPIRTKADYRAALKEVERLWDADPGTPDGDRVDVLVTLIEAYEAAHHPISAPDPIAAIDSNCVGCGNCGEVSEAAALCPSFYRADIIHNPSRWDRFVHRMRSAVIGWLQRRRESNRIAFAD